MVRRFSPHQRAGLCHTSRARSRPAHSLPVWGDRGGSQPPFPCGGGGRPHRSCEKGSAFTERSRREAASKGGWPAKGSGGRPRLPRPFKVPFSPAAIREEEPAAGGGRPCHPPELRRGGPLPKVPFQPSASAQRGSPTACLFPALCPLYPAGSLAPTWALPGEKKRAPAPTEGARSSFETARPAF